MVHKKYSNSYQFKDKDSSVDFNEEISKSFENSGIKNSADFESKFGWDDDDSASENSSEYISPEENYKRKVKGALKAILIIAGGCIFLLTPAIIIDRVYKDTDLLKEIVVSDDASGTKQFFQSVYYLSILLSILWIIYNAVYYILESISDAILYLAAKLRVKNVESLISFFEVFDDLRGYINFFVVCGAAVMLWGSAFLIT
ncbi:hypothetical protein AYI70_g8382, partial [Smittium culicis]